jgi:hypothetical protein
MDRHVGRTGSTATIDLKHLPINEIGEFGGEKDHCVGDVLGGPEALHRYSLDQRLLAGRTVAVPLGLGRFVGPNEAGRHRVHRDAEGA